MTALLHKSVKAFWTQQHTAGHKGLVLLASLIQHTADTGDWTPMSRFVSNAGADRSKIGLIIRAAFGDTMTYKRDPKHETGGRFTKTWEGDKFNLAGSNTYATVTKAIEDKKSFRSEDFQKELRGLFGKAEAPKPDEAAIVKATMKYITGKAELAGMETGKLIAALQAELRAMKAAA